MKKVNVLKRIVLNTIPILILLFHYIGLANTDIKIISSSENHITIEFVPERWHTQEVTAEGVRYQKYYFYGSEPLGMPGEPEIPAAAVNIGVPLTGDVTINVLDTVYETIRPSMLAPVPYVTTEQGERTYRYKPDETIYQSSERYPQTIASLEQPEYFRNQRVVKIILRPLRYLPSERVVRRYTRIVLNVLFSGSGSQGIADRSVKPPSDEHLYKSLLLNYEQSRVWRKPRAKISQRIGLRKFSSDNWYKVIIRGDGRGGKEGFYIITGENLSGAGVPIGMVDPSTIQLFNNGGKELPWDLSVQRPDSLIENPINIVGGEDGKFDGDDYLVFYGRSLEGVEYDNESGRYKHYMNHYSYENVYWLIYGKAKGKRISSKESLLLTGLTPEESFRDLVFVEDERSNIFKSGMDWFGYELANDKKAYSHSFTLTGAVPADSTIYRFQMVASTTGRHYFRMSANGNTLGEVSMNGGFQSYILKLFEFSSAGTLMDGQNNIAINYLTTSDIQLAYVDWIEVEYSRRFLAGNDQLIFHSPLRSSPAMYEVSNFSRPEIRVFDVTDISEIRQISGLQNSGGRISFADECLREYPRRYVALTPSAYKNVTEIRAVSRTDLRVPRQVDYIIITHDNFYQSALQLESLREDWDPSDRLETEVVRISDILNDFGCGIPDPTAIRDFLVYADKHWGNPGYVLLLGDGHYDYKNILKYNAPNLIPAHETYDHYETSTRSTDDWYTYTNEGSSRMQMAIGRIPVQTVDEAQAVVDKIVNYETNYDPGEWRKTITIVGDDELVAGGTGNETDHTRQAEILAQTKVPDLLNVRKIYLMEYPAVRTASVSGVTKPLANEDLLDQINQGTLILNFIGHGNDELWTHERVLNAPTDFERIQNKNRLAIWVAATCEFAFWDQPLKQSFAERLLNVPERGAVAMVSSSRLAYSGDNAAFNWALYEQFFANYETTGRTARLGDAAMIAKGASASFVNSEKYGVFGDPTMRPGAPRYRATVDQISPDSLQALRKVRVKGYVEREGQLWGDYDGKLLLRVIDSSKQRHYQTAYGSTIDYVMPGNSIFRGEANIQDGQFDVEFIVPKDISYGGNDGRISLYFWNDNFEGTGHYENLSVGGTAIDLIDREGPEIKIHFGKEDFTSGDYTTQNPVLNVEITDSLSGVNITGDIGHQIVMTLNDDESNAKDMTEFFEYDADSYFKGKIKYQLTNLREGHHTIQIKAWDNSNNSAIAEADFLVVADSMLTVRNVLTYPNPMADQTVFTYELSRDAEVWIKLYSVSGRLLRKFESVPGEIGFNTYPEVWDGRDEDGDLLANGVYLYKLQAKNTASGERSVMEKIGRLIIAR